MVCSPTSCSCLLEASKLTLRSNTCGLYFRRIVEIEEVDSKPTPPAPEPCEPWSDIPSSKPNSSPQKRRVTDELDFSAFKRIRIVSKESRVKRHVIEFEDLPQDEVETSTESVARTLDQLEQDFLRRYRDAETLDNTTAANFATEYIEARRRQRQHRQDLATSRATSGTRATFNDDPRGLTTQEQEILDALRTTRQREEARTHNGVATNVNYTSGDIFGTGARSSPSGEPNPDSGTTRSGGDASGGAFTHNSSNNAWHTIEEALKTARGPLFESVSCEAASADTPTPASTSTLASSLTSRAGELTERSRASRLQIQRDRWRALAYDGSPSPSSKTQVA
jgi:hypothetical protein